MNYKIIIQAHSFHDDVIGAKEDIAYALENKGITAKFIDVVPEEVAAEKRGEKK